MITPTAIMERSPAPAIIRLPVPTAVRVKPVPSMGVGPPARLNDDRARLPAPAITREIHPRSIRGKIPIEIINLGGKDVVLWGHKRWIVRLRRACIFRHRRQISGGGGSIGDRRWRSRLRFR